MTLKKERPFFTEETPLGKIPREWLIDVEPKIVRHSSLSQCWIWTGALDKAGHPVLHYRETVSNQMRMRRVARYVMKMFFPAMEKHHDVLHACGNRTCLNPHHLNVRVDHWTQR